MSTVLTLDHPAWQYGDNDLPVRAVRSGNGLWALAWTADGLEASCVEGDEDAKPCTLATDPRDLPDWAPDALAGALRDLGQTHRLANPWLWDAVTTAILRQVVRADQARKVYRRWCSTHGTPVTAPHATLAVAPTPERALDLSDAAFEAVGAKFHRSKLRAAAAAYLEHHQCWASMTPSNLVAALTEVPGIGPWTAAAAAADFTGDFSVYPHNDLAVRTWAARIAPDHPWPAGDKQFGQHWLELAGPKPHQLHTLTLTTLTWGAHARATEHTEHGVTAN
ncbi:hypothetical protein [Streptomyces sp. NBC_01431]|uniref:hypothetical protein n=1 Tax=Streptomyces sp. NBC_01431 TaxID=2903863 RepID=UPI002E374508|nr:hypothetical protein [Streptomyces sp. NBC_01431]